MPVINSEELAALRRCKAASEILVDALRRIDKGITEHHAGWKGEVLAARNEARLAIARFNVALKENPLD
jgi:hypothetical protein